MKPKGGAWLLSMWGTYLYNRIHRKATIMANDFNNRPPVPRSEQPTQELNRSRVRMAADPAPQYGAGGNDANGDGGAKSSKGGMWKGVVGGAIGGAVMSTVVSAALALTGVTGGGASSASLPSTTNSSAGQTINIEAVDEGTTVSQAVAAKCLPSVVSVYVTTSDGSGIGSGVILDTEGNIITNYHVAGDATAISVTIDGQSYDATLVGGDASSDIAVIKAELNGTVVTPMEIGDSSALVVGDWVMTLGSPLGLDQSASSGIVSALYRNTLMTGSTGNTIYTNLIQVDAAINGGNSGGALVNSKGQLVGINTLYANASGEEAFSGIGFAIPGNYAVDIANKIIAGEKVTHAYIGVSCSTVNAQNAQANHLSVNQGAYVAEIAEGGPAEDAGIKVGDIVTKIGDYNVESADGLILAVRSYAVGDTVDVVLVRDGKEQTVSVTLGSDEKLQEEQEELARQQQEEYERQQKEYEEYLNQYQQQNGDDGYSPWDTDYGFSWPWEMWDWDVDTLSNPGGRNSR